MLQRLSVALAQVKVGNALENLLNEIIQIMYSLHRTKKVTKKVYNNIMISNNVWYKMDTIFVSSKNSKTCDPHRLLLNLSKKINLRRSNKCVGLSNLSISYT